MYIPRSPARSLDQGAFRTEEPFFIGIEDSHEGDLGQVEPLTEKVYSDEHVKVAQPEVPQYLDAFECVDAGVEVSCPDIQSCIMIGEVLCHLFGKGRYQDPFTPHCPFPDLSEKIVNLSRYGEPTTLRADIVGPICETGDVLGHSRRIPPTQEGDVMLVATAGAYGHAMSSQYNLRTPAEEVVLEPRG